MQLLRFLLFLTLFLYPSANTSATIRHVPSDYNTIQDGIDAAIDGDTVLVAPGTYTGSGNRQIDFLGKSILVISETGLDSTIIDGQGYYGTALFFLNNETSSSILEGFTISQFHNGITIWEASPTIRNCKIYYCGGYITGPNSGIWMYKSYSEILNCSFISCFSSTDATAIYAALGNPVIENSLFYWNAGYNEWGLIYCNEATITNCTFVENYSWGVINGSPTMTNCISWGNDIPIYDEAIINYSNIEGG